MKINRGIIFAMVGIILVLWQMLWPGYILTLDMVWGENLNFINDSVFNLLPFNYLLYFLNFILPSWLIQKLFLITLFFCLFYLPYRFFPFDSERTENVGRYWFSLFYVLNPFVYERFLAGHWSILLAYAFLIPFIYYLLKHDFSRGLFWLILIGLFSLHILAISLFILFVYLLIKSLKSLAPKHFLFFNLFDISHWQAFKTSGFIVSGPLLSVIMLYGFWAESYPWANYFIWPKLFIIVPVFVLLLGLIFLGIRFFYKNHDKNNLIFFLSILFLSIIFSTGIGESMFKNFNLWLFENIPFWNGFRDTTKWNSVIVLVYGLFGALGIDYLFNKFTKYFRFLLPVLFLLPIIYTYPMLGGFSRQIKPIWYPESWHEANKIFKQDKDCKALFLPWHLYLSFNFNRNLIIANPANKFFDCHIFSSYNIELGNASANINFGSKYEKINKIINQDKFFEIDINVKELDDLGIRYIIFTKDLIGIDTFQYNFLKSVKVKPILQTSDLVLYSIER